ncbi:MAG: hypothetical protein KHF84_09805 [Thermoplasmata archaeon]|nr:hypothetical protein [Candidatus Sysuiplasma jiujiangense]
MRIDFVKRLKQAVADLAEHGYSVESLRYWAGQLRETIRFSDQRGKLDMALRHIYQKSWKQIKKRHKGLKIFTIESIEPSFRHLLDQRIIAAADLIVLNRDKAIETTLARFSGWATSIPPGGGLVEARKTVSHISKPLRSQSFEERRLAIDQGHKLIASIDAVLGEQNEALAAIWHDHGAHDPSYDARKEHMARNGKIYTIRGNWALQQGLMKAGKAGYTDQITEPAQEVYCRCWYERLYSLRDLPPDMLTKKGRETL